jgi:nickel/cobalt transporter (NiCoT) family protein
VRRMLSSTIGRVRNALSPPEWRRLAGFGGAVVALHIVGWGAILYFASDKPVLIGLGTLAYTFGLRHAFDADHIAAIDNTTRKLRQQGQRPLGVGFFFSLGHSTIVLALAVGLATAAAAIKADIPGFQEVGGLVGTGVSGTFLLIIGVLNLLVLIDVIRIAREMRSGRYDEKRLEQRLLDRGFMGRFFIGKAFRLITRSWHMYPLGLLFGLGFDTASEVGLLALTAGAASGGTPVLAIVALPILFAAGMSLMDTADGVFMSKAYGWAFSSPVRKVFYNITVTSLSVAVALAIGTVEIVQVLADRLGFRGGFWDWLGGLDFGTLGYVIVGVFVVTWALAYAVWKARRIEERWSVHLTPAASKTPEQP